MTYHKIYAPHRRDPDTKKIDLTTWSSVEFYHLQDSEWIWTEKIDGTNIRVLWDGYRVSFAGRTDRAIIPEVLLDSLTATLGTPEAETLFEASFGDSPAVLYGEGYGPKINGGKQYGDEHGFVLFDVVVNDGPFLLRPDVDDVANSLGIKRVPSLYMCSLNEMVARARREEIKSRFGTGLAEGVVGYPVGWFLDRNGKRIVAKIKNRDYYGLEDPWPASDQSS